MEDIVIKAITKDEKLISVAYWDMLLEQQINLHSDQLVGQVCSRRLQMLSQAHLRARKRL